MLTLEEEMQLREQREQVYSLPWEKQALAEKQVECHREILEQRGKEENLADALFSSATAKCEPLVQTPGMSSDGGAIEAVIDRNLKDALNKAKNQN